MVFNDEVLVRHIDHHRNVLAFQRRADIVGTVIDGDGGCIDHKDQL